MDSSIDILQVNGNNEVIQKKNGVFTLFLTKLFIGEIFIFKFNSRLTFCLTVCAFCIQIPFGFNIIMLNVPAEVK
jgi:hypothetical protein